MLRVAFSRVALSKAPEGVKAWSGRLVPEGYQPSVKYWRTRAPDAATAGVAMLLPPQAKVVQLVPACEEVVLDPGA